MTSVKNIPLKEELNYFEKNKKEYLRLYL